MLKPAGFAMSSDSNQIKRGRRRRRSELKTLLMLVILELKGPIGRYRLKEMLGLSGQEGLVRLMLTELQKEGLTKTSKIGCELTAKGKEMYRVILRKYGIVNIKEFNLDPLEIGPETFILQTRGFSMPPSITELRDAAVREGASGAVLMIYEKGTLKIPTVYLNLRNKYPTLTIDLFKTLNLSDGDILIACFSRDKWRALEGGLATAMLLAKSS